MDGGKGWRVKSSDSSINDATIISRVMLRFRPIAPKPVTGDSGGAEGNPGIKSGLLGKGRAKRKYVRVKKNNGHLNRTKENRSSEQVQKVDSEGGANKEFLTLQLLPEKNDLVKEDKGSWSGTFRYPVRDIQLGKDQAMPSNVNNRLVEGSGGSDLPPVVSGQRMLETWVTVESVTDTCMAAVGRLGATDAEKMKNLENDTCPGFISDSLNRVRWVNEAYKKLLMVGQKNHGGSPEFRVVLVIGESLLPYLNHPAFTCWGRLRYTWKEERNPQLVPCDVWRMDCGGFAWRLDVKAALSLGL